MKAERFDEVWMCPLCHIRLEPETAHWNKGDCADALALEVERLWKILREVSEGRGRFSTDHHEHAKNTVEDMKELATVGTESQEGRYHALPEDPLEVGTRVRVFSDGGYKASKQGMVVDAEEPQNRWRQPVPPTGDHVPVLLDGDDGFWLLRRRLVRVEGS